MTNKQKYTIILKYTAFFATLLPMIQGTQLYFLFDMFNPFLLIMPVVMGTITGFLTGYYRYRVLMHIQELEETQIGLEQKVQEQTQSLQDKNKELENLLVTDPLTGLGNRIKLKNVLEYEAKRISKEYKYFSLFIIDIDYFKKYNDFYGHLQGDEVLRTLGAFLRSKTLETEDVMIRFGGEEFVVLMPDCNRENATKKAEELVEGIEALNIEHEKSLVCKKVTISLGIHTTDKLNLLEECECIQKADEALYLAKEQGRNRFIHS